MCRKTKLDEDQAGDNVRITTYDSAYLREQVARYV